MTSLLFVLACSPTPTQATDPLPPEVDPNAAVCARYWEVQALEEPVWTGDIHTCDAGDLDPTGLDSALAHINYARELAGLPSLQRDPLSSSTAQATATLMEANRSLSHDPPEHWTCWTAEAAAPAAHSLLARAPAIEAVRQYLVDFGNETTLVHRRWLLTDWIDAVGIGSTAEFNAIDLGEDYVAGSGWTAWPPPGRIPLPLLRYDNRRSIDTEGWSVQSDELDLTDVSVTVTGPNGALPVTVEGLSENYGSRQAIRFLPDGWQSRAGVYQVEVSGTATLSYEVELVRCPLAL